jgi:hypothetical protein
MSAGGSQKSLMLTKLKIACGSRASEPYGRRLKGILEQNSARKVGISTVTAGSDVDLMGHFFF